MADIMQRILAPDGCHVAFEGLKKPISRLNFNLHVELDRGGSPQAMLVHPGRTLDLGLRARHRVRNHRVV